jgi:phage shock protein A
MQRLYRIVGNKLQGAYKKIKFTVTDKKSPEEEATEKIRDLEKQSRDAKRAIADIVQQQKRLEMHAERLQSKIEEKERNASKAVRQGRDKNAKTILKSKKQLENQKDDILDQVEQLRSEKSKLKNKKEEMVNRIEQLKSMKTQLSARKTAAEANIDVNEVFEDLDSKMTETSFDKMKEQTREIETRAEILEDEATKDDSLEKDAERELKSLKEKELR